MARPLLSPPSAWRRVTVLLPDLLSRAARSAEVRTSFSGARRSGGGHAPTGTPSSTALRSRRCPCRRKPRSRAGWPVSRRHRGGPRRPQLSVTVCASDGGGSSGSSGTGATPVGTSGGGDSSAPKCTYASPKAGGQYVVGMPMWLWVEQGPTTSAALGDAGEFTEVRETPFTVDVREVQVLNLRGPRVPAVRNALNDIVELPHIWGPRGTPSGP